MLIKLPVFLHPHIPDVKPADGILFKAILDFLKPYGNSSPVIYPLLAFIVIYLPGCASHRFHQYTADDELVELFSGMAYMFDYFSLSGMELFSAPCCW